ncbi:hypothetical protein PUR_45660 [Paenibacillus sp. URB8-2]|nr:hypothetical protein PUR_45660 [Paenibacillus sp. URB8-2]
MRHFSSGEVIQPDTPAPPNRIAAVPPGLKVVGRREYKNVKCNSWWERTYKNGKD